MESSARPQIDYAALVAMIPATVLPHVAEVCLRDMNDLKARNKQLSADNKRLRAQMSAARRTVSNLGDTAAPTQKIVRLQAVTLAALPDEILGVTLASLLDLPSQASLSLCCYSLNALLSLGLNGSGLPGTGATYGARAREFIPRMPHWLMLLHGKKALQSFSALRTLVIVACSGPGGSLQDEVLFERRVMPIMPKTLCAFEFNCAGYVKLGELLNGLEPCRHNMKSLGLSIDLESAIDPTMLALLERGNFFPKLTAFRFNPKEQLQDAWKISAQLTRSLFQAMPNVTDLEYRGEFETLIVECFSNLRRLYLYDRDAGTEQLPKMLDLTSCRHLETAIFNEARPGFLHKSTVGRYKLPVIVRKLHIYNSTQYFVHATPLPALEALEVRMRGPARSP
jgi:hypothetical protein